MGVFMKRATQTRLPIKVQPIIIARELLRRFTPRRFLMTRRHKVGP